MMMMIMMGHEIFMGGTVLVGVIQQRGKGKGKNSER
jgi:hypothetical protein